MGECVYPISNKGTNDPSSDNIWWIMYTCHNTYNTHIKTNKSNKNRKPSTIKKYRYSDSCSSCKSRMPRWKWIIRGMIDKRGYPWDNSLRSGALREKLVKDRICSKNTCNHEKCLKCFTTIHIRAIIDTEYPPDHQRYCNSEYRKVSIDTHDLSKCCMWINKRTHICKKVNIPLTEPSSKRRIHRKRMKWLYEIIKKSQLFQLRFGLRLISNNNECSFWNHRS